MAEPTAEEIRKAAALMGRRAGLVRSKKKAEAARKNGQKGGRPRTKHQDQFSSLGSVR